MKRFGAIAFLVVILFNFYGYRLVISYMQSASEAYLEKKVDQNKYDESDLITIRAKLNMPYYTGSHEFERVYGSVNLNGASYQYVKRRIHNDTLELVCLPNKTKTRLREVQCELTKSFSDGQASTPKKNITLKISLPDFFQPFKIFYPASFLNERPAFVQPHYLTSEGHALKQLKPPKLSQHFSCASTIALNQINSTVFQL